MPTKALVTISILAVAAAPPALAAGRPAPRTLVELARPAAGGTAFGLHEAGGKLIDPRISVWRLPSRAAARLLPELRAEGLVRSVTPDLPLHSDSLRPLALCTDPLCAQQWWWPAVGADRWTPPGAGVPVTMIDSGTDLAHPEFAGRPNTAALNTQTFSAAFPEELHGTATASVVAAPANGQGVVGIYPQATLQVWDASPGGVLTVGDEIAGLAAASARGRSVINLSLGGPERLPVEEHAILAAFAAGSLVVASAGNSRGQGSPAAYPASFAHVLTVGATDESGGVTWFSTASSRMDLAAPGQDIPVAIPQAFTTGSPYSTLAGTSFSAPLVSGAAAAVWTVRPTLTNTQLFEVMRRSARRVGKAAWNRDTGYGILDAPAALVRKAPPPDPQEPNEDVFLVKPHGLLPAGQPALTAPGRPRAALSAHVERGEDPADVYRAYLPARGRLVVTVTTNANVNLGVWGRRTRTVLERGAAARRDLLGHSAHARARRERVVVRGRGSGQYVYVDVFLAKRAREAAYRVSLSTARR